MVDFLDSKSTAHGEVNLKPAGEHSPPPVSATAEGLSREGEELRAAREKFEEKCGVPDPEDVKDTAEKLAKLLDKSRNEISSATRKIQKTFIDPVWRIEVRADENIIRWEEYQIKERESESLIQRIIDEFKDPRAESRRLPLKSKDGIAHGLLRIIETAGHQELPFEQRHEIDRIVREVAKHKDIGLPKEAVDYLFRSGGVLTEHSPRKGKPRPEENLFTSILETPAGVPEPKSPEEQAPIPTTIESQTPQGSAPPKNEASQLMTAGETDTGTSKAAAPESSPVTLRSVPDETDGKAIASGGRDTRLKQILEAAESAERASGWLGRVLAGNQVGTVGNPQTASAVPQPEISQAPSVSSEAPQTPGVDTAEAQEPELPSPAPTEATPPESPTAPAPPQEVQKPLHSPVDKMQQLPKTYEGEAAEDGWITLLDDDSPPERKGWSESVRDGVKGLFRKLGSEGVVEGLQKGTEKGINGGRFTEGKKEILRKLSFVAAGAAGAATSAVLGKYLGADRQTRTTARTLIGTAGAVMVLGYTSVLAYKFAKSREEGSFSKRVAGGFGDFLYDLTNDQKKGMAAAFLAGFYVENLAEATAGILEEVGPEIGERLGDFSKDISEKVNGSGIFGAASATATVTGTPTPTAEATHTPTAALSPTPESHAPTPEPHTPTPEPSLHPDYQQPDAGIIEEPEPKPGEQAEFLAQHPEITSIHSGWEIVDGEVVGGVLEDGRQLLLDPDSDGVLGFQAKLAELHSDWSPDEVAVAAQRAFEDKFDINDPAALTTIPKPSEEVYISQGIPGIHDVLEEAHPEWTEKERDVAAFNAFQEGTRTDDLKNQETLDSIERPIIEEPEKIPNISGLVPGERFDPDDDGIAEEHWLKDPETQKIEAGVLPDGRMLYIGEEGGIVGETQEVLVGQNPELSPSQVGTIAQRAVEEHGIKAPEAVSEALSKPEVIQTINTDIARVSLEKILVGKFGLTPAIAHQLAFREFQLEPVRTDLIANVSPGEPALDLLNARVRINGGVYAWNDVDWIQLLKNKGLLAEVGK